MILKTAKLGNPILKKVSDPVCSQDLGALRPIVSDMLETLDHLGERIGLAAPQVFIQKRFFIYRIPIKKHNRYQVDEMHSIPLTVVINPSLTPLGHEKNTGWEACISVPGYMGQVERYTHIQLDFTTIEGQKVCLQASGFHARVLQHEYDHLDGICYTERMKDFSSLGTEEEILASFILDADDVA
jgi:peptide deformylase